LDSTKINKLWRRFFERKIVKNFAPLFLALEGIKRFLGFVHLFIFSARVKGDDLITINRSHRRQMTVLFDFSSESK